MDVNKTFQSKSFQGFIYILGILFVLLLVFRAGIWVGSRRADFIRDWTSNYHRNFGGPQRGFPGEFGDRNFIEANGTFGQIIKVDGQNLVIKGDNDAEKVVVVKDDTVIKRFQETIKIGDLKLDDYVVVIGQPNQDGQIEAKLIRLMPSPMQGSMMPFGSARRPS